jgi:hypothetical protein
VIKMIDRTIELPQLLRPARCITAHHPTYYTQPHCLPLYERSREVELGIEASAEVRASHKQRVMRRRIRSTRHEWLSGWTMPDGSARARLRRNARPRMPERARWGREVEHGR